MVSARCLGCKGTWRSIEVLHWGVTYFEFLDKEADGLVSGQPHVFLGHWQTTCSHLLGRSLFCCRGQETRV